MEDQQFITTSSTSTSPEVTTIVPLSNSTNLISLNASSQIPFKLAKDGGNYFSWKAQMTNLLFVFDLLGFVHRSNKSPGNNDPAFSLCICQDRLMLLNIQSTIHSTIGPIINGCTTSTKAWSKLEANFANRSTTRMVSSMASLMSLKKEGKTVATYISRLKSIGDDLALIGHPLNDAQIMCYTLNGFGSKFKEFAGTVDVRDTPISFEDLHDKLLDEELLHGREETKDEDIHVTTRCSASIFC